MKKSVPGPFTVRVAGCPSSSTTVAYAENPKAPRRAILFCDLKSDKPAKEFDVDKRVCLDFAD